MSEITEKEIEQFKLDLDTTVCYNCKTIIVPTNYAGFLTEVGVEDPVKYHYCLTCANSG